jgi:hypothetical protein
MEAPRNRESPATLVPGDSGACEGSRFSRPIPSSIGTLVEIWVGVAVTFGFLTVMFAGLAVKARSVREDLKPKIQPTPGDLAHVLVPGATGETLLHILRAEYIGFILASAAAGASAAVAVISALVS